MQLWHVLRLWIFNEAPTEPTGKRVTSHSPASFEFTPSLLELTAEPQLFECHNLHLHKWWAVPPAGINNHGLQHLSIMREHPECDATSSAFPSLRLARSPSVLNNDPISPRGPAVSLNFGKVWRKTVTWTWWTENSHPEERLAQVEPSPPSLAPGFRNDQRCSGRLELLFDPPQVSFSTNELKFRTTPGGGSGFSDRSWKQLMELNETSENGR